VSSETLSYRNTTRRHCSEDLDLEQNPCYIAVPHLFKYNVAPKKKKDPNSDTTN